jgi:hypothetical protein
VPPRVIGVFLTDGVRSFDAGIAAQSVMLTAWNEEVCSPR